MRDRGPHHHRPRQPDLPVRLARRRTQDKKYAGEPRELVIGDRNTIREFCTFNIGTVQDKAASPASATTTGSWPTCTSRTTAWWATTPSSPTTPRWPATCELGDWVTVGGLTGIHQFVKIGAHAMVGFASAVSQDVPPFMLVDGNPLAVRGFNVEGLRRRGFSARAHRRRQADAQAAVPRGPARWRTPARAIAALAAADARGRAADVALMTGFLAARHARHRPLTAACDGAPRFAMVAGEASGDLLAGLLLAACRRAGPRLHAHGIGGPQMAERRASRPGGRTRSWRCAAMSRCCATTARSSASATSCASACWREPPDAFIGVDAPDFNLDLEADAEGARHQDRALRLPLDLGLARRARREDPPRLPTMCCASSPSSPSCCARHGIAATYVGHPLASVIPHGARPGRSRARALGLRDDGDSGRHAAGQPRAPKSSTWRGRSSRPRRCCSSARPGHPLRRAGGARACGARSRSAARAAGPARRPAGRSTASRTPRWPPAT